MIEFEGAAKVRRWLVVGMPVALVIRLLIELAQRL